RDLVQKAEDENLILDAARRAGILAGATAVEVGTGLFVNPSLPIKLARGLEKWVRSQGVADIGELVGALRLDG
ncbi:MAG: hypothetical protein ACF8LK_07720, partial [Phycisphaerales bacterium JB041]